MGLVYQMLFCMFFGCMFSFCMDMDVYSINESAQKKVYEAEEKRISSMYRYYQKFPKETPTEKLPDPIDFADAAWLRSAIEKKSSQIHHIKEKKDA